MTMIKKLLVLFTICAMLLPTVACSVDQALSDIDLLLQTANVICSTLGAVAPAEAAACQLVAGIGSTGLGVIRDAYKQWKATGSATDLQKLQSAITTLKANLPAELAAAHITNPQSASTITKWVNLVSSTLNAVLDLLPKLQASAPGSKSARIAAVAAALPTPETLHARWQAEVCSGDPDCGNKVKVRHLHPTASKFSFGLVR